MKKRTRKLIRTHKADNDMIIFRLLQGQKKLRTVHTFGYGTCHGIWSESGIGHRLSNHDPGAGIRCKRADSSMGQVNWKEKGRDLASLPKLFVAASSINPHPAPRAASVNAGSSRLFAGS